MTFVATAAHRKKRGRAGISTSKASRVRPRSRSKVCVSRAWLGAAVVRRYASSPACTRARMVASGSGWWNHVPSVRLAETALASTAARSCASMMASNRSATAACRSGSPCSSSAKTKPRVLFAGAPTRLPPGAYGRRRASLGATCPPRRIPRPRDRYPLVPAHPGRHVRHGTQEWPQEATGLVAPRATLIAQPPTETAPRVRVGGGQVDACDASRAAWTAQKVPPTSPHGIGPHFCGDVPAVRGWSRRPCQPPVPPGGEGHSVAEQPVIDAFGRQRGPTLFHAGASTPPAPNATHRRVRRRDPSWSSSASLHAFCSSVSIPKTTASCCGVSAPGSQTSRGPRPMNSTHRGHAALSAQLRNSSHTVRQLLKISESSRLHRLTSFTDAT